MPQEVPRGHGPYGQAASAYWDAGWRGILPLPLQAKKPVPVGWTGNHGEWPSYPDVMAWVQDMGGGNIALRLPSDVLGIDCDNYADKPGAAVLGALQERHGPLPATWRVSSRDDGQSGISLYRIPPGLRWPGVLGPGIETIRFEHRYAVVWPSVHPNGGTYRWRTPDGLVTLSALPTPDELPELPEAWVSALTHHQLADVPGQTGTHSRGESLAWLGARGDQPCPVMADVLARGLAALVPGASRHDGVLGLVYQLVNLAAEGHRGADDALGEVYQDFRTQVGTDRKPDELVDEMARMVAGAVRRAGADGADVLADPCTVAIGHLGPLQALQVMAAGVVGPGVDPAPDDDADEVVRTSWWPRDVVAMLADDDPEPGPAFLIRADGVALFYPGRINGLLAPAESGKTWVGLLAVVQAAQAGQRSSIIDFEDTHRGTSARLTALGLTSDQLRDFVAYIAPDERLLVFSDASRDLSEHLATWEPRLIVLDGVNAAMTLHGFDLISNHDATLFSQLILHPLVLGGAAVVYIDHTPKDRDDQSSGGIGAQAKRAMTTGCAIRLAVVAPFGKGQSGILSMTVDKDRPGDVRGVSLLDNGYHRVGTVKLTSHEDGSVDVVIEAPGVAIEARAAAKEDAKAQGEVDLLIDVCACVRMGGPDITASAVVDMLQPRRAKSIVLGALGELVDRGYLVMHKGPKGAHLHTVVRMFTASVDDLLGLHDSVVPSGSQRFSEPQPKSGSSAVPGPPPPFGGNRTTGNHSGGTETIAFDDPSRNRTGNRTEGTP